MIQLQNTQYIDNDKFSDGIISGMFSIIQKVCSEISADIIDIPKGATNGDIMKVMFPNIEVNEIKTNTGGYIEVKYLDTSDKCDATAFRKNWWNEPYIRKVD